MFSHPSKIRNLLRGFLVKERRNGKRDRREEETANDQIYPLMNIS